MAVWYGFTLFVIQNLQDKPEKQDLQAVESWSQDSSSAAS